MKERKLFSYMFVPLSIVFFSCEFGGIAEDYNPKEDKSAKLVAGFPYFTKYTNPTAYIPTECYTDTGIIRNKEAFANPCYVCHNAGNTPVDNAGDWLNQIDLGRFPTNENPWYNATAPEKTIEKPIDNQGTKWTEFDPIYKVVKDNKKGIQVYIEDWIKKNNWEKAYQNQLTLGTGKLGKYKFDMPPLYRWNGNDFEKTDFIDNEGFIYSSETEHSNNTNTWWRAYDWKHFPGFFPTNGRLDSAMIRLPEKFRKENGVFNKEIYKINLSLLECALKQITKNCEVEKLDSNLLDKYNIQYEQLTDGTKILTVLDRYIGDASDEKVWQIKGKLPQNQRKIGLYPVGTELAHPVFYINPDWKNKPELAGKVGQLKEFRYMKKLVMQNVNESVEEEEENINYFPYDNGLMPNDSETWLIGGWIENEYGDLRPQSEEEMAFCMACHGAISGTVDNTFSFWRKLSKSSGWKDTNYSYSNDVYDIKYWAEKLKEIEDSSASYLLKIVAGKYNPQDYGEYQFYFTMTNGIDHFRSNFEGVCKILGYDKFEKSSDGTEKCVKRNEELPFEEAKRRLKITEDDNLLTNSTYIGYLNSDNSIKQSLFLPSKERTYGLDGKYLQVVLTQQFVRGRDVFDTAFGIKHGEGNSLEDLVKIKQIGTGLEEKELVFVSKTLLDFYKNSKLEK